MLDEKPTNIIDVRAAPRLINWHELVQYRDLFYFLVWRDIKTRYAQSVLGIGWAVIQPFFNMVVFTIVFGNLAKIDSDGVPYAIFSYTALVPWTYFANALTSSSGSLINSSGMISKVYFPRIVIPFSPVISKLIDFAIASLLLLGMMIWYKVIPGAAIFYLPFLILLMMITAAGMGMWLTALSVQYRDVNYAMAFVVQLLMYAAPVVYSSSKVPENFRYLYGLFPMAGVIEGFRAALLGSTPMPWDLLMVGTPVAIVLFVSGLWFFQKMERRFADVV